MKYQDDPKNLKEWCAAATDKMVWYWGGELKAAFSAAARKDIMTERLVGYASRGMTKKALRCIARGADINGRLQSTIHGSTALSLAAYHLHVETVEALLKEKANPNTRDRTGQLPILIVFEQMMGNRIRRKRGLNIAKALFDAGADLGLTYQGMTAREHIAGNQTRYSDDAINTVLYADDFLRLAPEKKAPAEKASPEEPLKSVQSADLALSGNVPVGKKLTVIKNEKNYM